MIKVAAYGRVSTDDQQNSLANQKSFFTDYIDKNKDWKFIGLYTDEGISGTGTVKRKEFNRMINDAMKKDIDLIITKEVSRFARNTVDTLNYTRKLKAIGVGVYFVNDNINTLDGDGEFRLSIMASVAQEESRKTSERVKWGMKRQMEQGYVFVNSVFGYDCKKGVLTINDIESEVVKNIFCKFVYEDKSLLTITKELNNSGAFKSKRIKRWYPITIKRILSNEKYVGDLLQKKTYTPDYLNHKSIKNTGQEEKVFIKDHHEPIINRDLWDKAQRELQRRGKLIEDKTKYSNTYWCSGLLRCGVCGSICITKTKYLSDKTKYIAWKCKESAVFGNCSENSEIGCINKQINERALLSCIQHAMKTLSFNRDSIIDEIRKDIISVVASPKDISKIKLQLSAIEQKKEKILDLLIDETIDRITYNEKKQKLELEYKEVLNTINNIELENEQAYSNFNNIDNITKKIFDIVNQECVSQEVYKQIIDKIVLCPDNTVDIFFKYISEPIKVFYESSGRGVKYITTCSII